MILSPLFTTEFGIFPPQHFTQCLIVLPPTLHKFRQVFPSFRECVSYFCTVRRGSAPSLYSPRWTHKDTLLVPPLHSRDLSYYSPHRRPGGGIGWRTMAVALPWTLRLLIFVLHGDSETILMTSSPFLCALLCGLLKHLVFKD